MRTARNPSNAVPDSRPLAPSEVLKALGKETYTHGGEEKLTRRVEIENTIDDTQPYDGLKDIVWRHPQTHAP